MNHERKERFWREYMAVHLWYAAKAAMESRGYELNTPSYAEIMNPAKKPEELTTEQITGKILGQLKG